MRAICAHPASRFDSGAPASVPTAPLQWSIRRVLDLQGGRQTFEWETTVAEAKARNIHVHDGVAQGDFVETRKARDKTLDAPTLILPSLKVNIDAGALPHTSAGGRVFSHCRLTSSSR